MIPKPPRLESSGYRAYPPNLVRRIRAVCRARELGFSLEEIARLFDRTDRGDSCEELEQLARRRLEAFRDEIRRLERKVEGLEGLLEASPGEERASDCPIVDVLVDS